MLDCYELCSFESRRNVMTLYATAATMHEVKCSFRDKISKIIS
jgi:hypothetical protein